MGDAMKGMVVPRLSRTGNATATQRAWTYFKWLVTTGQAGAAPRSREWAYVVRMLRAHAKEARMTK